MTKTSLIDNLALEIARLYYQIGRGLKIGYLNLPDIDETSYDWILVTTITE